jgi:molybdate transport system substrate-binding protein
MPASPAQPPRSKPVLLLFFAIVVFTLAFGIVALLRDPVSPRNQANRLLVHCAASLKTPMEKVAADYLRDTKVAVELSFGGSQTLLANIAISKRGDLYVPADDSYIAFAREKNLITESLPLAEQTAVLAVPKGNPKRIASLTDFANSSLTLSQANPEAAAIGKLVRAHLGTLWSALSNRTVVFKPTVIDAANDVKLGAVDAAIVWDSMQQQYPDLEFIRAPELAGVKAKVAVAVLKCSERPEAAQQFARYVAARDKGLKHFEQSGFTLASARP